MGANLILPAGSAAAADSTPAEDPVTRSLRFEDGGSPYLVRAASDIGTPTDAKKVTVAFWFKLGNIVASRRALVTSASPTSGNDYWAVEIDASHRLRFHVNNGNASVQGDYITNRVFRDPSAWTHICLSCDSTAAEADRAIIYVNGVRETSFSTTNYWPADWLNELNEGAYSQYISSFKGSSHFFDGLIADVYNIDGQQLEPTNFIEANNYGGYIPKAYTGSFGNNGWHIDMQPQHDADYLVTSVDRNDGDTTFAEVASGNTLTTAGNPEHSIAVGNPFTGDDRAIVFNPSNNDMLEITSSSDFQFGTGDFTIEGWYNFRHLTGDQVICDLRPSNTSDSTRPSFSTTGAGLKMHFAGGDTTLASSGLVIGKWHHIEISRSSNTLYCFIDGTQTYSNTFSSDLNTDCTPHLGSTDTDSQVAFLDGYVFDYHILKGFGRHTSNFTVPTEKSTKDSTYTVLLLQPDKDDTGFDDLSDSVHTITATGSPTRTASTPYDAAAKSTAMYFDGNDTINETTDLTFGTGAFTIEFWYQHVSDVNGGQAGAKGDVVISKGRRSTSYQGWVIFTHNNGTNQLRWSGFKVGGNSSVNYLLTANDTGRDLALDGDWHHIAVTRDGSGNMGMFVDGTRCAYETGFGGVVDNSAYKLKLASSYDSGGNTGQYANCYLYDVRITKGEARYDPTSTSVTKPSDPFELNPVYIGGDQSGNKNHFQPTGISPAHDILLDTPTNNYCLINSLAETKTGNNSYYANPTTGLSEGNLKLTSSQYFFNGHGTLGVSSGKWYFEWYSTGDYTQGGFTTRDMFSSYSDSETDFWVLYNRDSTNNIAVQHKDGTGATNADWAGGGQASGNGNVFGCAFDVTNRKMYFHKNGQWSNGTTLTSTFPSSWGGDLTGSSHNIPADTTFFPTVRPWTNSTVIANFGQDSTFAGTVASGSANAADINGNGDFRYAPPSGYFALCTANLDDPTVTPSENFGILTYVGNSDLVNSSGSTQNVTGVNFDVGMAWIKDRDNSAGAYYTASSYNEYGHYLFDTITGTSTGGYNIDADVISSEGGPYLNSGEEGVTSFSAGSGTNRGITVDEAGETNYYDNNPYGTPVAERYVAWLWKLGSTGDSSSWNNSYTAPTNEHYNSSAGVTTIEVSPATSGNLEVAHSLSEAPEFFFVTADAYSENFTGFIAFHKDLTSGNYLYLDYDSAQTSDSTYFPSGAAHADYIKLGSTFADTDEYGFNLRIWAFTGVEGYSKFGKYTGNGSTDGPFIYTGFRPAFVLWKRATGSSNSWNIMDNKREGYNPQNDLLFPDSPTSESNVTDQELLSNGFKLRTSGAGRNANNETFIYAAFAESPFKHANAR